MIKIEAEVADSPDLLAKGLMYRKSMGEFEGMLFKFLSPLYGSFWGKNTYIPLDIAFIKNNEIKCIKNIVPMSTKSVSSNDFCDMAIEVNAGFFSKNNIKSGDKIKIHSEENNKCKIEFLCN